LTIRDDRFDDRFVVFSPGKSSSKKQLENQK